MTTEPILTELLTRIRERFDFYRRRFDNCALHPRNPRMRLVNYGAMLMACSEYNWLAAKLSMTEGGQPFEPLEMPENTKALVLDEFDDLSLEDPKSEPGPLYTMPIDFQAIKGDKQ